MFAKKNSYNFTAVICAVVNEEGPAANPAINSEIVSPTLRALIAVTDMFAMGQPLKLTVHRAAFGWICWPSCSRIVNRNECIS